MEAIIPELQRQGICLAWLAGYACWGIHCRWRHPNDTVQNILRNAQDVTSNSATHVLPDTVTDSLMDLDREPLMFGTQEQSTEKGPPGQPHEPEPQRLQSNGDTNQESLRADLYSLPPAGTYNAPFSGYAGQTGRGHEGETGLQWVPEPNRPQTNRDIDDHSLQTDSYNIQPAESRDPHAGQVEQSHKGEVGLPDSLGEPARVRESLTRATRSPQPLPFDFTTPSASSYSPEMSMAPATPQDNRNERAQNGSGAGRVGPHPSFIQVANPYVFEQKIQSCLAAHGSSEAKEDTMRLQGVLWIDTVRKALQLPVRTFNTAVVYYHKFRLVHSPNEYIYVDAAAAALFTACKIEDTLKKSREILCAAHNMKIPISEHASPDDQIFDQPSKTVVGLERLMLESSGFDFRNRYPQVVVIKLARSFKVDQKTVGDTAFNMCIDIYRTWAPLKQSTGTLAFSCIELASRIHGADLGPIVGEPPTAYKRWSISRGDVMETLLDLLDLYTHHSKLTIVGTEHPMEIFINTRITLNKEASSAGIPRFVNWRTGKENVSNGVSNGSSSKPPPLSPAISDPRSSAVHSPHSPPVMGPTSATGARSRVGERSKDGPVRFMLEAQKARDEQETVAKYFAEDEYEEYEEEIEVEVPLEEQQKRR